MEVKEREYDKNTTRL